MPTHLAGSPRSPATPRGLVAVREAVPDKARRYLGEGRVRLARVNHGDVCAFIDGGGPIPYVVTLRRDTWRCTCPAWGRCCHLVAVRLVAQQGIDAPARGPVASNNRRNDRHKKAPASAGQAFSRGQTGKSDDESTAP